MTKITTDAVLAKIPDKETLDAIDDDDMTGRRSLPVTLTLNEWRFVRARLASTSFAPDGAGWQPIETAPKDGTRVLLASDAGTWVAEYRPVYQSGYRPKNPWASMMLNHDHIQREQRSQPPTRWQPLPAAPQPVVEKENG